MTTESCMTRVHEMIEDLKETNQLLAEGAGVDSAGDPTGLLPVIFFTGDFLPLTFCR